MMQPAALDNYSGDACSLLCMPVSPPVLVIANRNGNIHHAVVLPRDVTATDSADESDDQDDKRSDIEVLITSICQFNCFSCFILIILFYICSRCSPKRVL